jgi:ketopantoate reductase
MAGVAVICSGGVGGYVATVLCERFGEDVRLCVRTPIDRRMQSTKLANNIASNPVTTPLSLQVHEPPPPPSYLPSSVDSTPQAMTTS